MCGEEKGSTTQEFLYWWHEQEEYLYKELGISEEELTNLVIGFSGGVISSKPTSITGFTKHGIDQLITRGVNPVAILDAIKNPIKIKEVIDELGRLSYQYIGKKAGVTLNKAGKVITTWPK